MLSLYINQLRPMLSEMFKSESSGHDIYHLERTMNTALFLQRHEGGDSDIIGVSAYLHDVHRLLSNQQGKNVNPNESIPIILELLEGIRFPDKDVSKVVSSIDRHEIYNWNDSANKISDIETLILQDADNLDAIGAIGIARTFIFSGAKGIIMYNPDIPIDNSNDYSEETGNDPSTIHHIHHKLLKLGENMNTATAKIIARSRINLINDYVNSFLAEWNGNITI